MLRYYSKAMAPLRPPLSAMNLIVLPITTKKKFLFYTYHNALSLQTYLELALKNASPDFEKTKIQAQINGLKMLKKAQTTWENLGKSKSKALRMSYHLVQKMLSKIDWFETCLSSIPSQQTILREVQSEKLNKELAHIAHKHKERVDFYNATNSTKAIDLATSSHKSDFGPEHNHLYDSILKPIPLYYPKSILPESEVRQFLSEIQDKYYSHHVKQLVLCVLGLPLTIPLIALPVVPNIPGFYLCYRIYCHLKVLAGLKHLKYLQQDTLVSPSHLVYTNLDVVSRAYLDHSQKELENQDSKIEKLLINQQCIDQIVHSTGLDIKHVLENALKQEKQRLAK